MNPEEVTEWFSGINAFPQHGLTHVTTWGKGGSRNFGPPLGRSNQIAAVMCDMGHSMSNQHKKILTSSDFDETW